MRPAPPSRFDAPRPLRPHHPHVRHVVSMSVCAAAFGCVAIFLLTRVAAPSTELWAVWVCTGLSAGLAVLLLLGARSALRARDLLQHGPIAHGTITAVEGHAVDGPLTFTIQYDFNVDGELFVGTARIGEEHLEPAVARGDVAVVAYDPAWPTRNRLYVWTSRPSQRPVSRAPTPASSSGNPALRLALTLAAARHPQARKQVFSSLRTGRLLLPLRRPSTALSPDDCFLHGGVNGARAVLAFTDQETFEEARIPDVARVVSVPLAAIALVLDAMGTRSGLLIDGASPLGLALDSSHVMTLLGGTEPAIDLPEWIVCRMVRSAVAPSGRSADDRT